MFYATQSKINLNCKLCVCSGFFFFKFKKSYLLSKELELEGQIKSWTTVRMYLLVTAIILSSTAKKEITTGKYRIIWPHGCVLANLKKQNKKPTTIPNKKNKKITTKSHQLVAVWGITILCQLMGLRVAESEPCNGNPSPTLYFPEDTQGLLMFVFPYHLIWFLCCQYQNNYLKIYAVWICWYCLCQVKVTCKVGSCHWTLYEILPAKLCARENLETVTKTIWKQPENAYLSLKAPNYALRHCCKWA